jgi:hypothetical protein
MPFDLPLNNIRSDLEYKHGELSSKKTVCYNDVMTDDGSKWRLSKKAGD